MFAPPVAKPKAKTASNDKSVLHRAAPLGQRHADAEPEQMLRRLPQGGVSHAYGATGEDSGPARASANARPPGLSWNFSNVPAYSPGRETLFQMPPLIATPHLPIQAKLKVGAVNDPLEHEADRVAEQVMRMPAPDVAMSSAPPQVSRKCDACEEEEKLQKKEAGPQAATGEAPASMDEVLGSPGQPLDAATRAYFEPRFGHDFSQVRVHTGPAAGQSARHVNAYAYTVGRNMVFDAGRFAPGTQEGRRLIAHELTHVVQQQSGPIPAEERVSRQTDEDDEEQKKQTATTSRQQSNAGGPAATKVTDDAGTAAATAPAADAGATQVTDQPKPAGEVAPAADPAKSEAGESSGTLSAAGAPERTVQPATPAPQSAVTPGGHAAAP